MEFYKIGGKLAADIIITATGLDLVALRVKSNWIPAFDVSKILCLQSMICPTFILLVIPMLPGH
jgi:hypothetical protein